MNSVSTWADHELRINVWSARFVTGSVHRPRSGCNYPTAASSIVLQNDSEDARFLPYPTALLSNLPRRPWEELGAAECQTTASLAQEGSDPTLGVLSQLPFMTSCPPGLPVAAGEHPHPSAGNGWALYPPLAQSSIKGLLEGLQATNVHPRNLTSARGFQDKCTCSQASQGSQTMQHHNYNEMFNQKSQVLWGTRKDSLAEIIRLASQ